MPSPLFSTAMPDSDFMLRPLLKTIPEIRMRNRAQPLRALAEGAPAQVSNAVLGDDHVGVSARSGDRPSLKRRDDARVLAVRCRRRQRDDRPAARRRERAANEVQLATDGPEIAAAGDFGV